MTNVKLICKTCGKEFETEYFRRNHKYCSSECYHKSGLKGKPPIKERRKCIVCNDDIPLPNRRFCSIKCRSIYWTGRERNIQKFVPEEKICPICNKIFLVGGRDNKRKSSIYCSKECQHLGCRKNVDNHSDYERSASWFDQREEILNERGIKCEFCRDIDVKERIQLHHIIPVQNGGNYDKENLMLLCLKCHAIIGYLTKTGYKNNKNFNPKEMIIKLKELLNEL